MRPRRAKILLAVLILILALAAVLTAFAFQTGRFAPKSGPMKIRVDPDLQGRLQRFEARLEALRQEHHISGLSVAIVKGEEVVYLKGLGTTADGRPTTPGTTYTVPSMNRLPGQTWTVRNLAQLDVLLARGGIVESRPYLAWHSEGSGDTRLQWSSVQEKDASMLYLKVPEKKLALILLANGPVERAPVSAAFSKTFLE